MSRGGCGIVFGAAGSLLLAASVMAFGLYPSYWTLAAAVIVGILNSVLLTSFGRALYDVFIFNWSPSEEE